MENASAQKAGNKWLNVPVIATITRLLCRDLTLQNEYLLRENNILKSKLTKRISFTDEQRHTLAESAMAMSRELMEKLASIVQPKTILPWQRRLEKQKWDYSDRRRNDPGGPRIAQDNEYRIESESKRFAGGFAHTDAESVCRWFRFRIKVYAKAEQKCL